MCSTRKGIRVTKYLLAGVTVFCVSWIACVNEWNARSHWNPPQRRYSTMKTIVAYSEGKQAEMDRPSPVTCDRLPDYPVIPEINRTWSPHAAEALWQRVEGTPVSLYAAYYDERAPQHYVRVLAIFHGRNLSSLEDLYCQTRVLHDGDSVEVVAAKPLEIWWQDWDKSTNEVETPFLLSCPLTEPLNNRADVSIVTEPCDNPTNGFHIGPKTNNNYQRSFTICVKDMNFQKDISSSLIEWIETNRLLGAEVIDFYIDSVNKNTEATLRRYQSQGLVRLFQVPIKNTARRSLWQRRRDHLVSYNDCLYRNILETEFIVPLDVDEVLVPKITNNWHGLLKRLPLQGWDPHHHSAILVRNVFFFDFMQHLYKNNKTSNNRNRVKLYMKRDDVRIDDEVLNEIVDLHSTEKESNKHITEMGKDENDCTNNLDLPKLSRNIVSSATISPIGYYSKSFMLTRKVLTAFNHYPLASIGATGFTGWAAPYKEVQLNHYKETCNFTMVPECAQYVKRSRIDRSALHLSRRLARAIANTICK
ncbi:unnamed protein product [Pieris macdunnoughi]|uniref:Glycosyltransferase family 92 protein n=1 Tax=Pieris macdunnoughi TaxID=345717 RepID=A0A821VCG2_9NEOP|nr:unnamed protein product [Pieris macdunnoughi]